MKIQTVVEDGVHHLTIQGNWVSEAVATHIRNSLNKNFWNCRYTGGLIGGLQVIGNRFELVFSKSSPESGIAELCEYIEQTIRPMIPRAFLTINVSPYGLPEYGDKGGLTILMEIAAETGCDVDYGEWLKPVTFRPESNVQYNRVIELLNTFKMTHNGWVNKERAA